MRWICVASLLPLLGGCSFDGSGTSGAGPDGGIQEDDAALDAPRDARLQADQQAADGVLANDGAADRGVADAGSTPDSGERPDLAPDDGTVHDQSITDTGAPDQAVPDQAMPDQAMPDQAIPDQAIQVTPVRATALKEAFAAVRVECVDRHGTRHPGSQTPIIDEASIEFYGGADVLWGIPGALVDWIDGRPTVVVRYDPHACDLEDPVNEDGDWSDAGLLVRGATINDDGELVVPPDASMQDINLIDVGLGGIFESEFAGPDDVQMPIQLNDPISKAKRLILQLAGL